MNLNNLFVKIITRTYLLQEQNHFTQHTTIQQDRYPAHSARNVTEFFNEQIARTVPFWLNSFRCLFVRLIKRVQQEYSNIPIIKDYIKEHYIKDYIRWACSAINSNEIRHVLSALQRFRACIDDQSYHFEHLYILAM